MRLGGNEDGYAAVLALLFVAIVATLTVSMTRSTSTEFRIASNDVRAIRIREALASGVELAVFEISERFARRAGWLGRLSVARDIGTARVEVEVTDEAAFVDLNKSDPALVLGVFAQAAAGVPALSQDQIAAALRQRPAPFQTTTELHDMPGLGTERMREVARRTTVFSVDGRINPLASDREVLASLPGVSPENLEAAIRDRPTSDSPADIARMLGDLPSAAPLLRQDAGPIYRVVVTAHAGSARGRLEATVWVGADKIRPYRVLAWREGW
ncbi:hypothetical protein ACFW16_33930 [Inquilinus sp. NPDC058860]|uniref:hypothetical protein n=1 Tax=Inquilinus sp. NPDC058860 TaxID=3346652 RepID=UPI00367B3460